MHRAELHGRPGAGVEGVVIEVVPRKKLVHSFEPKFIEDGPSRVTYEIERMGMVCKLTVTHDEFPARDLELAPPPHWLDLVGHARGPVLDELRLEAVHQF